MKGIVFNVLETVVSRAYGEDTWDQLLHAAQLDGAYSSLGSYPDEHLLKLVAAASEALKISPQEVIRWFGRQAAPCFAEHYPQFFQAHRSTRTFVLTLNSIIHPEVRKLYPGAQVPDFGFDASSPDVLVMSYQSARKLCAFAEGLIEGTADYYRETVRIEHPQCMLRGDTTCKLHLSFTPQPA